MSVLVVGVSHHSASVSLLEQVAPEADAVPKLVQDVAACEHVMARRDAAWRAKQAEGATGP